MKKKGKGGLNECPKCKDGYVSVYDSDSITPSEEIKRLSCNGCKAEFTELWRAINWEETILDG